MFPREISRRFSSLPREFLNGGIFSPSCDNSVDELASGRDGAEVLTSGYDGEKESTSQDEDLEAGAPSSRALDFVIRASQSNRSLDDHFMKISGSKFDECKQMVDVSTTLVGRRKSSESRFGEIYEDLKDKLEYEESDMVYES